MTPSAGDGRGRGRSSARAAAHELRRVATRRTTPLVLLTVLAALGAGGCSAGERVCSSGEYPVRTVDASDGGLACARDGEGPPAGYERFPAGEVPEYVDDLY